MYDTNHNGSIDKKEMEKIILAIYDLIGELKRTGENDPKKRVVAIFEKLGKILEKRFKLIRFYFE